MDRWQLRIDNYWKFRFHEKIKKKRKKRERIKKIIIDYQKNKKETIGLEIHYQLSNDNCQLPKYPQNPGTLYELSTDLNESFQRESGFTVPEK